MVVKLKSNRADSFLANLWGTLLPKEDAETNRRDLGLAEKRDAGEIMEAKKVMHDQHGPRHVTPAGRSIFLK